MLSITGSHKNTTLPLERTRYVPSTIFSIGQRIVYEGEEAHIIRLRPFPVVKTGSRVICGDLLAKIKKVETTGQEGI